MTTNAEGKFETTSLSRAMPHGCVLEVSKAGYLTFRGEMGFFCENQVKDEPGCRNVRAVVELVASPVGSPIPLDDCAAADEETITLILRPDGILSLGLEDVSNDEALLAAARAARRKNVHVRAVVVADTNATHGKVVHILELLRQAEISNISVGARS